jgi:hypothetical protein
LFHCNLEINVDESCNNTGPPDQCKDPMSSCTEVVSGDYICSCNPGYYNNGGTCTIRKYFNIFIKITKSIFLVTTNYLRYCTTDQSSNET